MKDILCPFCQQSGGQVKAGRANNGEKRFKCNHCQRRYAPKSPRGYPPAMRETASRLHGEGKRLREIGQLLGVNPQTVLNWVREAAQNTPAAPLPTKPPVAVPPAARSTTKPHRPTINDVAAAAGVSNSTISNYLNHNGHMSAATKQRIEAAIASLDFTPSALVRAIHRRQTRIFGVVLFGLSTLDVDVGKSLTPALLAGINDAAEAAEYDVLLYPGWPYHPRRQTGLPFLNGHIDGLLWVAPPSPEPNLQRIADAGLPVVALLTRDVPAEAGYVNADNSSGIYQIVAYLRERGHRRIGFIGPINTSNFRDRHEAYRDALRHYALERRPEWEVVLLVEQTWSGASCGHVLDYWLSHPERPTAVLLSYDGLATILLDEMNKRGLRAPEDLSVTGFDDILEARHVGGGLSTIRQPFRQIGSAAVNALIARIQRVPVEECRLTLPTELIVRATTGAPPV